MAVSPDPDQLAERARQIAEALQAIRADSPDATFTELEDGIAEYYQKFLGVGNYF